MDYTQAARLAASLSDMLQNAELRGRRSGHVTLDLDSAESGRYRWMLEMAREALADRAAEEEAAEREAAAVRQGFVLVRSAG